MNIVNPKVGFAAALLAPVLFLVVIFGNAGSGIMNHRNATADLSAGVANQGPEPKASIVFVGDIMMSRGVAQAIKKNGGDANYPFLKLSDYLKSADIGFANLETPITAGREIVNFEMVFRSDPGIETALKSNGFGLISLANNHTGNFGSVGFLDTFKHLNSAGIIFAGAGEDKDRTAEAKYFEIGGIKFALLAYTDPLFTPSSYVAGPNKAGVAMMDVDRMILDVKAAKGRAQVVIVSMHAGIEYKNKPNKFQTDFARAAVDAGAELVIGHHPHVVQSMEKYNGKYIFYSLGNFVFDQMFSVDTRQGLVVKAFFDKNGVSSIELAPTWMERLAQPRVADIDKYHLVLGKLNYDIEGDATLSVHKQ